MKEEKLILKDIFSKLLPKNYPGRIYGMYFWDGKRWVIDKKFCNDNGITIRK